ncbi:MAG: NAD(P)/FAD-dependent oxidoreductase [Nitrospiraceae bacterium]|nr:NAD(P)/FAD-dependent oxidoreductase [Nitrospiraceae bacterium]
MSTTRFDLLVVGTGSAATAIAFHCRSAGWAVGVIDSRPFGGTCALRGCDPKKVLVGAAELVDWARRMQGKGIRSKQFGIDWGELMRFKRSFTQTVPQQREKRFEEAGIVPFHGRARFIGPRILQVATEAVEARYVVIATGAQPRALPIQGAEYLITSDQFLELEKLPDRIAFIGGGYISFEFAHIAARAGAQVTILHRGRRPLGRFDPDLVDQLVQHSRDLGMDVQVQTEVKQIERGPSGFTIQAWTASQSRELRTDLVVHGAGRVPELGDLALDVAGIQYDASQGITVNDYLQSVSNPTVYAAGDAAASGGPPLTPVAGYEGEIVAANLLKGNHRMPDYAVVPSVVFTIPPLASVGVSEQRARELGLRVQVHRENTSTWYSSRRVGETCSEFKVLVEEGSGRIVGAHVLGHLADEVINLFALAMRTGLTTTQVTEMMFAYPTHGSDLWYMA